MAVISTPAAAVTATQIPTAGLAQTGSDVGVWLLAALFLGALGVLLTFGIPWIWKGRDH